VDGFGRIATDLRISVTDRCNFRCRYCMPPEGLPWLPKNELLTYEEMARVARVLVDLGITSIKITGGEPLARRDLPRLVALLRDIDSGLDISLTTNGYLLGEAASELAGAGLDRVTVSCDSLLHHRFKEITLRDALAEVLLGLEKAASAGLTPVKVNAVIMRGVNEDEVNAFARLARATGYAIRFIEYMPLDAQSSWSQEKVVSGRSVLARICEDFELTPRATDGPEPSTDFAFADGAPGSVGIIPSVTEPFCSTCNRLRLTADGQLRACLFSLEESDLRGPLRAGAADTELASIALACVAGKWAGHRIGHSDFVAPARSMSMIGG
jgi:GTP 3',8-cyclase